MDFIAKEISISDEGFGITISISQNKDEFNPNIDLSFEAIVNSMGKYILLQKTYAEDESDTDYYYFESHDRDKRGELEDFEILLTDSEFMIKAPNFKYKIGIKADSNLFNDLKQALQYFTKYKGKLTVL